MNTSPGSHRGILMLRCQQDGLCGSKTVFEGPSCLENPRALFLKRRGQQGGPAAGWTG